MDVSYSAWLQVAKESLMLGGESFSFLFDRRYTNRLNRMSKVFFEAYVRATNEVAAEEDRFPSLSEIESRMESGAIYAYKDRLMRSTEFFDEIKISGISYLVPRALCFADETNIYTDLTLNFDEGTVTLPKRRKASVLAPSDEQMVDELDDVDVESEDKPSEPPKIDPLESMSQMFVEGSEGAKGELDGRSGETKGAALDVLPGLGEDESAYEEMIKSDIDSGVFEENIETISEEDLETTSDEEPIVETPERLGAAEGNISKSERNVTVDVKNEKISAEPSKSSFRAPPVGKKAPWQNVLKDRPLMVVIPLSVLAIFVLLSFYVIIPFLYPDLPSDSVYYSAYLTNESEDFCLNLDVRNPKGLENDITMVLPPDIDRSISATGGVVSISYSNNTVIQLLSSNDARVSVCLVGNSTHIPVIFNVAVPLNYDSSLQVHDEDYQLTRRENTIILMCNCTDNQLDFEQVYHAKRVSGFGGSTESGPENLTESS